MQTPRSLGVEAETESDTRAIAASAARERQGDRFARTPSSPSDEPPWPVAFPTLQAAAADAARTGYCDSGADAIPLRDDSHQAGGRNRPRLSYDGGDVTAGEGTMQRLSVVFALNALAIISAGCSTPRAMGEIIQSWEGANVVEAVRQLQLAASSHKDVERVSGVDERRKKLHQ